MVYSKNTRHDVTRGILAASFLTLTLAACQQNEEAGPPILNGKWASSDGVYTAEFLNGSFQAVANDTGGVISRGEYLAIGSDKVRIRWVGMVSGQANQAECARSDVNRLDCVDVTGNQFSLTRTL